MTTAIERLRASTGLPAMRADVMIDGDEQEPLTYGDARVLLALAEACQEMLVLERADGAPCLEDDAYDAWRDRCDANDAKFRAALQALTTEARDA